MIIYSLFYIRQQQSGDEKLSFIDSIKKFWTQYDSDDSKKVSSRQKLGLKTGISFILILLQELKDINSGRLLKKSLEYLHETLMDVEIGSIHTGDKVSFIMDKSLTSVRAFLVGLITDTKSDKEIVRLAHKILLLVGLASSSVEYLLLLLKILKQKPHGTIDL